MSGFFVVDYNFMPQIFETINEEKGKMIKTCPECDQSEFLFWKCYVDSNGGVVDGRHRMHEMNVSAVLGCEYCSADIETITESEIETKLNGLIEGNTI
jgi:uncharacterized protein with PIN domain